MSDSRDRSDREKMPAACERFFFAINIDPFSDVHQKRIRDALTWADDERAAKAKRDEAREVDRRERRARVYGVICSVAAAVIGMVLTWAWQHFVGHQ